MSVGQKTCPIDEAQIARMVDRFLGWTLPETLNPDGGLSFIRRENAPMPTGTNFLDAQQAEQMVRHMIEGWTPSDIATRDDQWVETITRMLPVTPEDPDEASLARSLADRFRDNLPPCPPGRSLSFTCPFDETRWAFHSQEQVSMIERHFKFEHAPRRLMPGQSIPPATRKAWERYFGTIGVAWSEEQVIEILDAIFAEGTK